MLWREQMNNYFYKICAWVIIMVVLLPGSTPSIAQRAAPVANTISGTVTDSNGIPLVGVTVKALFDGFPIIFVSGFKGFPPQFTNCSEADHTRLTTDAENDGYFGEMDDLLKSAYPVRYAHLISNPCYTAPLEVNAEQLRQEIGRAHV